MALYAGRPSQFAVGGGSKSRLRGFTFLAGLLFGAIDPLPAVFSLAPRLLRLLFFPLALRVKFFVCPVPSQPRGAFCSPCVLFFKDLSHARHF